MNCFSGLTIRRLARCAIALPAPRRWALVLGIAGIAACGAPATESAAAGNPREYRLEYTVTPDPARGYVSVTLRLSQQTHLLREVQFLVDDRQLEAADGDGELVSGEESLSWYPPAAGGELRWQLPVPNERNDNGYDAWLDDEWGLFRAEDIIPRAATRTLKGARSKTKLRFRLPPNWSVVTQYAAKNGAFEIDNKARRFDQPNGWIVMGRLGVRRDTIAGVRVAVAAPVDNDVRRLDMLALLNWTLPELARILPDMPPRVTIVSAGDPMWRGGLSAPQSLFIHASRPMISENGTSTLLHEVMHVIFSLRAAPGYDWIVEGLAEYFSLELLRRSGTLSESRYERSEAMQQEWSEQSSRLCGDSSTGARTALAVSVFIALDDELRKKSDGEFDLDDLLVILMARTGRVDVNVLDAISMQLIGEATETLQVDNLPGCSKMAAARQS